MITKLTIAATIWLSVREETKIPIEMNEAPSRISAVIVPNIVAHSSVPASV